MTTTPDEFDFERSRAAVTVACLQWLRCTGPTTNHDQGTAIDPAARPRDHLSILSGAQDLDPSELSHPLWDRWLDG